MQSCFHRIGRVALPFILAVCSAAQVVPDGNLPDIEPIRAFRMNTWSAFQHEDFQQLEQIATAAATSQERFPGGVWKLAVFYGNLQGPGSLTASDERWALHLAKLERWVANSPRSAIPRTALAQAYERYAWKARGNGWANTVTKEGWAAFHERIQKARTVLEEAQSLPNRDAQWFAVMQTVALAQAWPKSNEQPLADSGSALAPGYTQIYIRQVNYLLPKWHGQPGEAQDYLTGAADKLGGANGDLLYFQVVAAFNVGFKPQLSGIDWERVKRGFAAIENQYQSTNYQRNAVAFLALQNGDKDFASKLFNRIEQNWDAEVWHSKPNFDQARTTLSLPSLRDAGNMANSDN